MNVSCDEWQLLDSSDQWSSVDADGTLETFRTMYLENQLLCAECYGMSKGTCSSSDPACDRGLQDLAMSGNESRWDQGIGVFTQSQSDLNCGIEDSSQCNQAPECTSDHGPAGLVLLKSMTTMHNSLSNVYMAIDRAHGFASNQMSLFTSVFAPVPSLKNKAIFTEIMFVIAGVLAGFIPGIWGASAAMLILGVGSAFVMNDMIFGQPSAPDTSTVLAKIVDNTQSAYEYVADSLFANGSYNYLSGDRTQHTLSWSSLMANGSLLQQQDNGTSALETVYERMLYQQLAVYTWKNLEDGKDGHIPFIAFDTQPCDQSPKPNKTASPLDHIIKDVSKSDTNMTYNGNCYYLLDGTTKSDLLGKHTCIGKALPGGTNKDLDGNWQEFRSLSLSDFIVPSIKGWQNHEQQNDYQNASALGSIYTDPQDAGVVSLPICDYLGKPGSPGVGCPRFGGAHGKSCYTYDESTGINEAGDYVEGSCGVHVEQWKKNDGNQLSVNITDNDGRTIGLAAKQSAAETLEIVDSVLPYNLYVATGASDDDAIRFWYANQYWDSDSKGNDTYQCTVKKYSHDHRDLDCSFDCPKPDPNADSTDDPSPSATIAHPFPNTPVAAVAGSITYSNIYITATPTSNVTAPAPTSSSYATGQCSIQIRQYKANQGKKSDNDTPDDKIQVVLKGADSKPIAGPNDNALLPAPAGTPVTISGLPSPVTVTVEGKDDKDPLGMSFGGQTWFSNDTTTDHRCKSGGYSGEHRDINCGFRC